jgi:hypothetical protein
LIPVSSLIPGAKLVLGGVRGGEICAVFPENLRNRWLKTNRLGEEKGAIKSRVYGLFGS